MLAPSWIRGTASFLLVTAAASSAASCATVARRTSGVLPARTGTQQASVIPGNWDQIETLRSGSPVAVTLRSGDRVEGVFKALTIDMMILTDAAGRESNVPRPQISKIVATVKDPLSNGALIGAGAGLVAALVILGAAGSGEGYILPSAKWGAPSLLTGIGAVIGVFVDRAHETGHVLYVAR